MRAFQILAIQPKTLWNQIYKSITSTQKLNLGRWEHRENEKQKEINKFAILKPLAHK